MHFHRGKKHSIELPQFVSTSYPQESHHCYTITLQFLRSLKQIGRAALWIHRACRRASCMYLVALMGASSRAVPGVSEDPGPSASHHCLEPSFAPLSIDRDLLTSQCNGNSCRARFKINSPNGSPQCLRATDTTSLGALKLKYLDRRHSFRESTRLGESVAHCQPRTLAWPS